MQLPRYLDPRATWRGTSEVDKVRLYTRQSFVGIAVFMGIPGITDALTNGRPLAIVFIIVCVVAAILAVLRLPGLGGTTRGDIRPLVAGCVAAGVAAGITGTTATPLWSLLIIVVPVGALITMRWSLLAAVAISVAATFTHYGPIGGFIAFVVTVSTAAGVRLSMWLLAIVTELDSSREAAAALSVAEERLRFSRDLHDVVGRALSAIAVKSELAATLSRRGDDRAAAQMDEVRELAQESMTETRRLVRGYRSIDLEAEIDGARSLLTAAGIETTVLGHADTVAPPFAEAAAWVVREGATNILRHSDATRCRIQLTEKFIRISNNHPTTSASSDGTGISGLRERLAIVGGTVDAISDDDSFSLTATFAPTEAS